VKGRKEGKQSSEQKKTLTETKICAEGGWGVYDL
jgi:hypothetical protein